MQSNSQCNETSRIENYVFVNRLQYANNIENLNLELEHLAQSYNERLAGIGLEELWLLESIETMTNKLNSLEVLSDLTKSCIDKYRKSVPSEAAAKSSIEYCISTATNQLKGLISAPTATKNGLQNYYATSFENAIQNCDQRFPNSAEDYNICVSQVVSFELLYLLNITIYTAIS